MQPSCRGKIQMLIVGNMGFDLYRPFHFYLTSVR